MLNRCEFIGNLGKDPEIRSMQNGDKVANFSIAVSEKWTDKNSGEKREKTTWVPVVVWGGLVRVVEQFLHKGSKVYVAGKFTTRKWQDQSGQDKYSTEVVLQGFGGTLVMLDGPSGDRQDEGHANSGSDGHQAPAQGFDDSEDIPFAPCVLI